MNCDESNTFTVFMINSRAITKKETEMKNNMQHEHRKLQKNLKIQTLTEITLRSQIMSK